MTFHHWKSDKKTNFLMLTLHYIITKDWILRSHCLSVKNLEIQEEHKDNTAASTAAIVTTELRKNDIHISQVLA